MTGTAPTVPTAQPARPTAQPAGPTAKPARPGAQPGRPGARPDASPAAAGDLGRTQLARPWEHTARSTTVLIAHGSPDPRHAADVADIARRLSALQGGEVLPAFIEHNEPRADHVVPRSGDRQLVVLPLLLTAGFHWSNDIPAVVASGAGHSTLLAPPPPELFAAAVVDLVTTADTRRAVVVLAGSRSPLLAGRMAALSQRIEQIQSVQHGAEVEVLLARDPQSAAALMDPDTAVVPFVVADGIFADRIRTAAAAAGAAVTPVLGSTGAFTAALAAYIGQDPE